MLRSRLLLEVLTKSGAACKGAVWGEDILFRTVPAVHSIFYGRGSTQNFFLSRMAESAKNFFLHPLGGFVPDPQGIYGGTPRSKNF